MSEFMRVAGEVDKKAGRKIVVLDVLSNGESEQISILMLSNCVTYSVMLKYNT